MIYTNSFRHLINMRKRGYKIYKPSIYRCLDEIIQREYNEQTKQNEEYLDKHLLKIK